MQGVHFIEEIFFEGALLSPGTGVLFELKFVRKWGQGAAVSLTVEFPRRHHVYIFSGLEGR